MFSLRAGQWLGCPRTPSRSSPHHRSLPTRAALRLLPVLLLACCLWLPAPAPAHPHPPDSIYMISLGGADFLMADSLPALEAMATPVARQLVEDECAWRILHRWRSTCESTGPTVCVATNHYMMCQTPVKEGIAEDVHDVIYHWNPYYGVLAPIDECPGSDTSFGNPCDAASGAKTQVETDYRGAVGSLAVTRRYNSLLGSYVPRDWGLGFGWSTGFHKQLQHMEGGILAHRPGGYREPFTPNAGLWQAEADSRLRLIEDVDGYTLFPPGGGEERYDLTGRLLAETGADGRITHYGYDAAGRLETVTGPFGHALSFAYYPDGHANSGHVQHITLPTGGAIDYSYDADNNLTAVGYPDGSGRQYHYEDLKFPHHLTGISVVDALSNVSRFATYSYHADYGKAASTEHAGGQERFSLSYDLLTPTQATVTDAAGNQETLTFSFNLGMNRLLTRTHAVDGKGIRQGFDTRNNLTSRTDEEGRVTKYTYNPDNQKTSAIEAYDTPEARTTTYEYLSSELDLSTFVRRPSVYAGAQQVIETRYEDALHPYLPTAIIQSGFRPDGTAVSRTTRLRYNAAGQVIEIDGPRTDVNDITTLAYYDCTTGAECGQLQAVTNALGQETTYDFYDADGRVKQLTDANGVVTTYGYTPLGQVETVTQTPLAGAARVTRYGYTAFGAIDTVITPEGITLTHAYDAAQDLRSITDNLGNKIEYDYDIRGNRSATRTLDPDGTLVRTVEMGYDPRNHLASINAAGALTTLINDAVGNRLSEIDPNNNADWTQDGTTHAFDALDRLRETIDLLAGLTDYDYDASDRLTRVQSPNGATTGYVYDDLGNLLQETSPDRGTLLYTHDTAGNVKTVTDARGIEAGYTYDALNRLTTVDYPGTEEDIAYAYDTCVNGKGRLCAVTDASGTTGYAYDGFGNLVEQQSVVLGVSYTTGYDYDAGNRITRITYPDGRVIDVGRDALGRLSRVDAIVNGVSTPLLSAITYRADHLRTGASFGNGHQERRVYDLQGRLTELDLPRRDETTTLSATLAPDAPSPQPAGTPITFTAQATGGSGSYEYQFLRYGLDTGYLWTVAQDYGAAPTYTWTPDEAAVGTHGLEVRVRNAGSVALLEGYAGLHYTIISAVLPATGVTLTPDPAGPQLGAGATVTFSAQGQGGSVGSYEYRFVLQGPATDYFASVMQDYSTRNTWAWPTTVADIGSSTVTVHVRNAGSRALFEAEAAATLQVEAATPATGATLAASPASPQTVGTAITFTAQGTGGNVGQYEYQFLHYGPDTFNRWKVVQGYGLENTYAWTPTEAAVGDHYFQAQVRNPGSTATYEADAIASYAITSPVAPLSIMLTPGPTSPQPAGTTIVLTAQGAGGGVGQYEYQFWHYRNSGQVVQGYGPENTYNWTPAEAAAGNHNFQARVRNPGSTAAYQTFNYLAYSISAAALDGDRHSPVAMAAGLPRPPGGGRTPVAAAESAVSAAKLSTHGRGTVVIAPDPGAAPGEAGPYIYWIRSPETRDQWLAVKDYRRYLSGPPERLVFVGHDDVTFWDTPAGGASHRIALAAGPTAHPVALSANPATPATDTRLYTYDANGNVRDMDQASGFSLYDYDALDRLTRENLDGLGIGDFGYDPNGNRSSDGTGTYDYLTASNRLTTVNGATITLDNAGNLTDDGQGRTYTYNNAGRLAEVHDSGTLIATYTYNAQGQRVLKTTPQGTVVYHYDLAGNLILETTAAGSATKAYVWADTTPVVQIDITAGSDDITTLHTDHLNTPRVGTDANGTVVWGWDGEAFGATLADEDPDGDSVTTTVNLRFPGQYYDQETGLHYNWNRYYDPRIGRYITSDPIGLHGGLNTYLYANANPGRFVDPDGLTAAAPVLVVAGCYEALANLFGIITIGALIECTFGDSCDGDSGDPQCSKASPYQLAQAGITDPHEFKEEYVGRPVARYDICACKDGSIKIAGRGQCGTSGPKIDTWARWK